MISAVFKFPTKKPIEILWQGAFRYDVHDDEKQKHFFKPQHVK